MWQAGLCIMHEYFFDGVLWGFLMRKVLIGKGLRLCVGGDGVMHFMQVMQVREW
jgi:hypothetical protein